MKLYDFQNWSDAQNRSVQLVDIQPYEPIFEETFCTIRKGWNVIDVGSAVGYYTIKAGLAVGEEGKVLAIEPHPHVVEVLKMNLKIYGLHNVNVIQKAVGNKKGRVKLYEGPSRGGTSISSPPGLRNPDVLFLRFVEVLKQGQGRKLFQKILNRCKYIPTRQVNIDLLDDIVEQAEVSKVDLIKMDIQGSELEAIQGSRNVIEKHKPTLLIEVHRRWYWEPEELLTFLENLGYEIEKQWGHALLVKGVSQNAC
jgi:FkbM family methyltransferase